jgi:hypothetical protein
VVLPSNTTSGTVDIAAIAAQLKARGYISKSDEAILDVEYGIEPPYGGGNTSLSSRSPSLVDVLKNTDGNRSNSHPQAEPG